MRGLLLLDGAPRGSKKTNERFGILQASMLQQARQIPTTDAKITVLLLLLL